MTDEWRSLTHRFAIGGHHGYIIVATDEHDRPLLLEIRMAKAGGVLRCRARCRCGTSRETVPDRVPTTPRTRSGYPIVASIQWMNRSRSCAQKRHSPASWACWRVCSL